MPSSVISQDDSLVAAIDLGSNSFHLVVARFDHGQICPLTALSEKVQLAAGFDDHGRLTAEVQARAMACLSRFTQHLQGISPGRLRIVGTNALRTAKNSAEFSRAAEKLLMHPIEIIAGREEARLIYLGVSHMLASNARRLVVDIGGGSTEFIIGEKGEPLATESLHMGCVAYTRRFFADGIISAPALDRAIMAARQEIAGIAAAYLDLGWSHVVGSSGTIKAVLHIQQQLGMASSDGHITRQGLLELRQQTLKLSHVSEINLPGLKEDRKSILPAGLAILLAVFEAFDLHSMEYSDGALREGVLFDMLRRAHQDDIREHSIRLMMERYAADKIQAERVGHSAQQLFQQVAPQLALNDEEDAQLLRWAAQLHEIGTSIAHSGFHKHGAYLLKYSDMPGFSRRTQERLALLVGAQRRTIKPEQYHEIIETGGLALLRLCALLRLSVLLHHSRSRIKLPDISLRSDGVFFELKFPENWLKTHPLTREDFAVEANVFSSAGLQLTVT